MFSQFYTVHECVREMDREMTDGIACYTSVMPQYRT